MGNSKVDPYSYVVWLDVKCPMVALNCFVWLAEMSQGGTQLVPQRVVALV